MCGMVLKIVYMEITTMLSLNGKDKNIYFETKKNNSKSVSPYVCRSPPASIVTSCWSDAEIGTSGCPLDAGSPGGPSGTKPVSMGTRDWSITSVSSGLSVLLAGMLMMSMRPGGRTTGTNKLASSVSNPQIGLMGEGNGGWGARRA